MKETKKEIKAADDSEKKGGKETAPEMEYKTMMQVISGFHQLNFGALLPDMTRSEFCLLKCLEHAGTEKDSVKVSALVKLMDASPPAVSRTLKSLEEKGCTRRRIDEKDRRNTYVEITSTGLAKLKESTDIMKKFQDAVWSEMGQENMERLIHYLSRLRKTMKKEIELLKKTERMRKKDDEDI